MEAFGDADNVYCITITSNLSGSYNAAKAAADEYKELHPERNIHVFDSLSAGPELTLLALRLKELFEQQADHDTIVRVGYEYLATTRLAFSLESLHNLAANGRVPAVVAKATGILGIRLIGKASTEGTLQPVGKARGEGKVVPELFKHMKEAGYHGGRVRIHHCINPVGAQRMKDTLLEAFPTADIVIDTTKGLCSFYAEQGGMLIGYEV
jgi:DegV family protein with EDD domain